MMNFAGSVIAVIFGIIWTAITITMDAPFFFPIFGVVFIITGVVQAIYNYKNATGKNRYSEYDITDENEESDPIDRYINGSDAVRNENSGSVGYCPYCGREIEKEYDFCPRCGKKIPFD